MSAAHPHAPARSPSARGERLFLAVAIPAGVREAIRAALPPGLPGRLVRPERWHLTLRFLGNVDAHRRDALSDSLTAAAGRGELGSAFALRFAGLGAFPSARRARVLWLGTTDGAAECEAVAERVERVVRSAGFPPERRAFSAHLTLSRLDPPRSLASVLQRAVDVAAVLGVDAVSLYRSAPTPHGARYDLVMRAPLPPPALS